MIVLGIESSCDETAIAIVKDGRQVVCNLIAGQSDLLAQYGGVYPEQACRRHVDQIIPLLDRALATISEPIDLIAVAHGPGLMGPLVIGLNVAKGLSIGWNKPFIGINHVEAHLYAALMEQEEWLFPALGVVISGGHTLLLKILDVGHYELIGSTVDDAIGECFDKVARTLGLGYPGGPEIEKLAKNGNPHRYPFKSGVVRGKPWDFSFSGLKTSVLYTVKGVSANKHSQTIISEADKADVAASFQRAAFEHLIEKSQLAAETFGCRAIYLGGGVSSSRTLRSLFQEKARNLPIFWPSFALSQDNAAMIAGLGYHVYKKRGTGDTLNLEPKARIPLGHHTPTTT